MRIWACREMRPGFSFQSFLPGTISLRVTAQCPAKKDFHYNPSRMFFLHQKIIFYSEIVCASDCSENPFACSLQKIVAKSAPGRPKKKYPAVVSFFEKTEAFLLIYGWLKAIIYSNKLLRFSLTLLRSMKMKDTIFTEEIVLNKIYTIRGQKVMLDRDLATLYGIETKRLKEAVRRHISRFPEDFMFELNESEFHNWRTQFATSKSDKMGLRIAPMVFTEYGILMLSGILNSEKAIEVNIKIMRIFVKIRKLLLDNVDLRLIMEEIKKKTEDNTKSIELLFQYFDQLIEQQQNPPERKQIGFGR